MNQLQQVLPFDGDVKYFGHIFSEDTANNLLEYLLSQIPWKHDEVFIYGKHIRTARQVAWYGDRAYAYAYSGKTKIALEWTPELWEIKQQVEKITGEVYNSCLLNLYSDGSEGMGWHDDGEKTLVEQSTIAGVSFGTTRRFDFRHKISKDTIHLDLEHGSLVTMSGMTQKYWSHQIPKQLIVKTPRVNLTFRKMKDPI